MSFHSMRELVIWHTERGLLWQLGPALARDEEKPEAKRPGAGVNPLGSPPSTADFKHKRSDGETGSVPDEDEGSRI